MPVGKRVRRSPSRSIPVLRVRAAPAAERLRCTLVGARRPVLLLAAVLVFLARALRARVAFEELPATPCVRRWAPSAAGRVKLRPHSGQVSAPCFGFAVMRFLAVVRFLLVVRFFAVLRGRGLILNGSFEFGGR